jgi:hypothetical protein
MADITKPPFKGKWYLPILGALRTWYWRYLRTGKAYKRRVLLDEYAWCGKWLSPQELDELVSDLKGRVRY